MTKKNRKEIKKLLDNPFIAAYQISKKKVRAALKRISRTMRYVQEKRKIDQRVDLFLYVLQFFGIVLILISLLAACVFFQVGDRFDDNVYIVNIPKGYSVNQVGDLLAEKGVIDGKYGFNLIVGLFGLEDKIQAGIYEFTPNMSLLKIILRIKNGEVIPPLLSKIVFPEGISIYKMGNLLIKEGLSDGIAFRNMTNKAITPYMISKYRFLKDVPTNSLEGYLFPDTYLIQSNISAVLLADLMLARFNQVIMPYWRRNAGNTKYSLHEILTLASIIEKEAAVQSERKLISSVFHNRLKIRMYLGADPTIKYALERPHKIVSYDDLEVNSPYNTYKRMGLPPGPICSPGLESIKAAIYPAKTDYLYFVAHADGSHIFSKTWEEHEAAKKLTRNERIKKIYRQ